MFASRCPHCGSRTELASEIWESSGRLTRLRRCLSCGRETAVETKWAGRRPPSESAGSRRRTTAALWLGSVLAFVWIIVRVVDYANRATIYRGVADALEAFRAPVSIVAIAVLTLLAVLWARRGAISRVDRVLVEQLQLRVKGDSGLVISVAEGHEGIGHDHELARDREREARIIHEFTAIGRRMARCQSDAEPSAGAVEEAHRTFLRIGRELGELMGAGEAPARAILSSPASHMLLRVPLELSGLPWELAVLRDGSSPLWQLFAIGRQAIVPAGTARRTRDVRLPLRVLLLADLESDVPGRALPRAAREAAEIMELGAQRPDVLRVVRRTPRTASQLDELVAEGFDVIHFAGHGCRAPDGSAAWSLADGATAAPAEMRAPVDAPLLVFSNACVPSDEGGERSGGLGGALAEAFLTWGARAYVGPFWELNDGGGAAFAKAFYGALADGATLGVATQSARLISSAAHAATWASYVLYGDPTLAPAPRSSEQR